MARDPITNKVLASNEWWQQKILEHPSYKRFRYTSKELRSIFNDMMACGEDIFAPSFTQPLTQQKDEEDVYLPTIDEEEGSRDREDCMFSANPMPSIGVTDELTSIDLTTSTLSTIGTKSGSQGKRKVGEGSVLRKRSKVPTSKQIVDVVSVIANASKDRAVLSEIKDINVNVVMNELLDLNEVLCVEDFRCCYIKLMIDKTSQESLSQSLNETSSS
ncbi:hypothetical protein QN277_003599 [Acacia crassicarpa]|uniref:Uncharacterized protein n=1 Tax=Acacia crassicarpa TaxID=499986 RepID=A0AAE1MB08_9FABA|nr:hypothetical protein QN277_003599 [Acacia crassicarpa]